jgi:hypothetical protein
MGGRRRKKKHQPTSGRSAAQQPAKATNMKSSHGAHNASHGGGGGGQQAPSGQVPLSQHPPANVGRGIQQGNQGPPQGPTPDERQILQNRFQNVLGSIGAALAFVAIGFTYCQTEISREQMKISSRAWVTIHQAAWKPNKKPEAELWYKNTGNTPALDVRLALLAHLASEHTDECADYEGQMGNSGILGPGVDSSLSTNNLTLNEPSFTKPRVAHGRISYTDIFGRKHWMDFCVLVAVDSQRLTWCKAGNDAGTYGEEEPPRGFTDKIDVSKLAQ